METLKLGDEVIVIDPCYIHSNDLNNSLNNGSHRIPIADGDWEAFIEISNEGSWGTRISKQGITRNDTKSFLGREYFGEVWVDSGQMMIMDASVLDEWDDNDTDEWPDFKAGEEMDFENEFSYFAACQKTLEPPYWGILGEKAIVSTSGFGDGAYPVFVCRNQSGMVTQIEIEFIGEEEE